MGIRRIRGNGRVRGGSGQVRHQPRPPDETEVNKVTQQEGTLGRRNCPMTVLCAQGAACRPRPGWASIHQNSTTGCS